MPETGFLSGGEICRSAAERAGYLCIQKKDMDMNKKTDRRLTVQLFSALFLIGIGSGLLIAGFIVSPLGEIHNSVLVSFGEILTFAGALFGIDYRYREPRDR